ncbi:MAG: hypothetical protein ACJ790_15995 [Myxococcaceae bacterium]
MKILVFVLGLAIVSFIAFKAINHHSSPTPVVDSSGNVVIQQGDVNPQQQLQNVHKAADRIEQQQQERADDALKQNGN